MKNKFKEDLLEVLKNLRCIDSTGDLQVDSYVDESIEILKKIINDIETAPEVPVQEQHKCEVCELFKSMNHYLESWSKRSRASFSE
ncbi:MAG: hypothetical protein E6Y83_17300 [Clostridium butyricum]|nr:hypothetical protein [Clostridium butyricum]